MLALEYLDSLKGKQHIGLFYQDREFARLIEFRFIKNGLVNGEQCVYVSSEDSGGIILSMLQYGIPIKYFNNKTIKVIQIHNKGGKAGRILEKSKSEAQRIASELSSPFRIVSSIIPNINTFNGISTELTMEHDMHENFEDFGGSLVCSYDVSTIEHTQRSKWIKQLISEHHTTIFTPKFGESNVISLK
ncbi:MAG: MEDS domain-containing protein [Thaumarchaeota archaeon]|nr:MEDS domain-containing protein [Nitrososphaerota archaeon]